MFRRVFSFVLALVLACSLLFGGAGMVRVASTIEQNVLKHTEILYLS